MATIAVTITRRTTTATATTITITVTFVGESVAGLEDGSAGGTVDGATEAAEQALVARSQSPQDKWCPPAAVWKPL